MLYCVGNMPYTKPNPKPTRLQNWYENVFVDATMLFKLPYMQIWTALSNLDNTGFEPELLIS